MSTKVSLLPVTIDLELVQGTDNIIEFQLTDAAGTAVDITADTVEFTARDSYGGTQRIHLNNGPGQHYTPLEGRTRFTFTRTNTTTQTPTDPVAYLYELRRVTGSGSLEIVYITGSLRLMPAVGLGTNP